MSSVQASASSLSSRAQPQFERACVALRERARMAGANAKLPTVSQLCREMQIGVNTLDKALTQLEGEGMVRRVQGSGIWTTPCHAAIALVISAGLLRGAAHSPFWDVLIAESQRRGEEGGQDIHLHLHTISPLRQAIFAPSLLREIAGGQVHGVIGIGLREKQSRWLEEQGIPTAFFAGPANHKIMLDLNSAIQKSVSFLAGLGCQRIGFWNSLDFSLPIVNCPHLRNRQLLPFRRAVEECGLDWNEEWNQWGDVFLAGIEGWPRLLESYGEHAIAPHIVSPQEQGFETALRAFSAPPSRWPDALILTTDLFAHGVLIGLEKCGVRVGHDVQVVVFTNGVASTGLLKNSALHIIEFDPREVIAALFSRVETHIAASVHQSQLHPNAEQAFISPTLHPGVPADFPAL